MSALLSDVPDRKQLSVKGNIRGCIILSEQLLALLCNQNVLLQCNTKRANKTNTQSQSLICKIKKYNANVCFTTMFLET